VCLCEWVYVVCVCVWCVSVRLWCEVECVYACGCLRVRVCGVCVCVCGVCVHVV